ncbi:MAG: hypothetical protein A2Z72_06155 [Omnitrophica bacterium RBG_13_46_9]|nr:MAG: hypothetical protein A2Z72_06155 [Omnitrophica bacterium RBG_13_46_9]
MRKILIIDDDRQIRKIYLRLLTAEGYGAIEASTADDAYGVLIKEKVDLILLDIKMPEIDGSIIYEIIQSFNKKVRVIVTSVYPIIEQKQIIEGASDYYDKSQGTDVLLAKVKSALENETVRKDASCQ